MLAAVSIAMNCPSVYMHLLPFHVVDSYQLCELICIHMDGWIDRQADRHAGRQADILLNYVFAYMVYVHLCRYLLIWSTSIFVAVLPIFFNLLPVSRSRVLRGVDPEAIKRTAGGRKLGGF